MNSQSKTLIPSTFATQNLDAPDRAPYRKHLRESGAPTTRFLKDTRLIDPKLRQMSISFEASSVRVSGRPDHIHEFVKINAPDSDAAPVEIHDQVKDVRGGR